MAKDTVTDEQLTEIRKQWAVAYCDQCVHLVKSRSFEKCSTCKGNLCHSHARAHRMNDCRDTVEPA